MKKRIISLLLTVVMILGLVPMAVMADEAVVADCAHENVTETITSNEDGTHTVATVCDDCGQPAFTLEEPAVIDIDLEGAVAAAAAEGVFNGMTAVKEGTLINVNTNKALMSAFTDWTQANYGWKLASTSSAYTYNATYVKTYINIAEDALWAIGHCVPYYNANRNWVDFTFTADESGWYKFAVDTLIQKGNTDQDPDTLCNGGGNNNLGFKINGELVRTKYSFYT